MGIEVDAETKESTRKTEEKVDGKYTEGHEQKKPKWRPIKRKIESNGVQVLDNIKKRFETDIYIYIYTQSVQLKSGPYFNMSNLFTKIYNMLYYTTNLYLPLSVGNGVHSLQCTYRHVSPRSL